MAPHRRRTVLSAAVSALVVVMSMLVPSSATASQGGDELGVDEVSHSWNVWQVANIPRGDPLDDAWHTDIAFKGKYAFQGSYDGFTIYNIRFPWRPRVVTRVHCPGGQGDVSISEEGDLLFVSVDYARSDDTCESEPSSPAVEDSWEGIRIFDVSDIRNPRYVGAVRTDCGSHTHTLVPGKSGESVHLYVSSYGPSRLFPKCQPPHDKISIIEVPFDDPGDASVVATPRLFPDGGGGGTSGCHDITVYPEKDIAAGACMGDGILLDIADRTDPRVIDRVQDSNFAFWHSATFSNDASKVVFTDELGGGVGATCNAEVGPEHGANGVFDLTGEGDDRELVFRSYFKIPRHQQDTENCVAHNGSLIPVKGRDVMVQGWYQGGVSVWEFTDSANPREIGYWERGPLSKDVLTTGGSWSAYYYNGFVYSSDIIKGLDVLTVFGRGLSNARRIKLDILNTQTQYEYKHRGWCPPWHRKCRQGR